MSPQEIKELRIEVKQELCRLDLDHSKGKILIPALAKYFQKTVSNQTLSMALTGKRTGALYVELLENLKYILSDGEFLTEIKAKDN